MRSRQRDEEPEEETETRSRGRSRERGESREGRSGSRDRDRDSDRDTDSRSSRGRGRSREPERKKSNRRVAIQLDPDTYESYGLFASGAGTEVEVVESYYGPWDYTSGKVRTTDEPELLTGSGNLKKDDGTTFHTLALYVVYLELDTNEEHIEPLAAGDLNHYAPGLSPNEEDYAGGSAEEFRMLASGEMKTPNPDMIGKYMLPVSQGYTEDGDPIYKRKSATRGSNQDFYFHQLMNAAKAAGISLTFDKEDPNVRNLLVGIRGVVERQTNTLRKGGEGAGKDFKGGKSQPLVFVEIFEKGKGSSKRSTRRSEPEDEKPAERSTRRGSRREENDSEPEPERKSSGRGSSRKAKEDAGPDSDFLKDFEERVEATLSDLPNRASKLIKLTHLTDEYETREEAKWALDILTDEEWIDSFWSKSKLWDYNEEDNSVSL